MSHRFTLLTLGIVISSHVLTLAAAPEKSTPRGSRTISVEEAATLAIYTPAPQYPLEARMKRATGRGMALLEIDSRTGTVTSARMVQSTGWGILDNAALKALRQWRFKPGAVRKARIPINFTLPGVTH